MVRKKGSCFRDSPRIPVEQIISESPESLLSRQFRNPWESPEFPVEQVKFSSYLLFSRIPENPGIPRESLNPCGFSELLLKLDFSCIYAIIYLKTQITLVLEGFRINPEKCELFGFFFRSKKKWKNNVNFKKKSKSSHFSGSVLTAPTTPKTNLQDWKNVICHRKSH